MSAQLDEIDRRIVSLLVKDGRMPAAAIAREIGRVTPRAIQRRIERLISDRVIRVSAIVSPSALDMSVIADVHVSVTPGSARQVAESISALDNVSYCAQGIGGKVLSIQVYARDNEELMEFLDDVVGKVPGVTGLDTVVLPWTHKDIYEWEIPEPGNGPGEPGDGSG